MKQFEKKKMKKILLAFILAALFTPLNTQAQETAKKDTAKIVKPFKFKNFDKASAGAIATGDTTAAKKGIKDAVPGTKKIAPAKEAPEAIDKATFPGGERAIRNFVRKNLRYPEECKQSRTTGKAIIAITIKPDGTPTGFAIHKSSGNTHMDKEALRVARLMPRWTAAKAPQKAVEFKYMLSVSFRPTR